jgi:hypothetical protein
MRVVEGVKVAVSLSASYVTTPGTATGGVPAVKVKFVVLIVAGFIARLKVAVTTVLGQMPNAPARGVTEITVGGSHGLAPVVKLHTKLLASAMPYTSVAPVVIVAV